MPQIILHRLKKRIKRYRILLMFRTNWVACVTAQARPELCDRLFELTAYRRIVRVSVISYVIE